MKRASVFMVIGLYAAVAGCEEKKPVPAPEPTGTAAASARPTMGAPGTTTSAAVAVRDEDIPVEADFEAEAERDIVPGNLDEELTKIEKELAAEPATEGGALQPGGARPGTTGTQPAKPR
jgi:hypothetical protein